MQQDEPAVRHLRLLSYLISSGGVGSVAGGPQFMMPSIKSINSVVGHGFSLGPEEFPRSLGAV
jgi:hypothetical protein